MCWTTIRDELDWLLILALLALLAGCAATPNGEDTEGEPGPDECPAWKIAVVVNEEVQCVDEDMLQRELEMIDNEELW